MEIQTEIERDPAVGNIIRDSPETQVDTEVFENSFGVKTAKESGIRTLHENEDDAEYDAENDEDDSDNGGAQRKPKNKKPVRPEKRADRDNDESDDTWEDDSGAEKAVFGIAENSIDVSDVKITADVPHNNSHNHKAVLPRGDPFKCKKYVTAKADSDNSAAVEMVQTGGTIRTAVNRTANGIGCIQTMVKDGVRFGTKKDAVRAVQNIGSGIRTGAVNIAKDTGNQLLRTKVDKSKVTDSGTEAVKQGFTNLRYADNTRKAVQNTARGTVRTVRAVKNMPRETKAQMQRIRKNAERAKKAAQTVTKAITSKTALIILGTGAAILLIVMLFNGLLAVICSAVVSMFSWMCPDGDTADETIQTNISSYITQIQQVESDIQSEIDSIANSLAPEYRYDGSQIYGLNQLNDRELNLFDYDAVLAVLAVQKYHNVFDSNSADFSFTDDEIRSAVELFYDFDYWYDYDHCPDHNCSKDSDCWLSLADDDFRITSDTYDSYNDIYRVTMQGGTYYYAESLYTRLETDMLGGGTISGSGYAGLDSGAWSMTYTFSPDLHRKIDWDHFYLTVDTVYCYNSDHCYLKGSVVNYSESEVLDRAGFSDDDRHMYEIYREQINAVR